MTINPINYSFTANNLLLPKKRSIYFAANQTASKQIQGDVSLNTKADLKINKFKESGDLYNWAKFLNSKQFPHKQGNEERSRYIEDYFNFLQGQAKEKLGATISIKIFLTKKNNYFSCVNPEEFNSIYETIAKYKTLSELSKNKTEKGILGELIYPKNILITEIDSKGTIDRFGEIELHLDHLSYSLEHEIGHLKDINKNDFEQTYSYLDVLKPEEKNIYKQFGDIYSKSYYKFCNSTPNLLRNSFHFPDYNTTSKTLINLKSNFKNLKKLLPQLDETLFNKDLINKVEKIVDKLTKFHLNVLTQISSDVHHSGTPIETKAQAWAKRASGRSVRPDYLLPISEELEAQLAKLGMPEPETYTILPKKYLVKQSKKLWQDINHINFGEELIKSLKKIGRI